MNQLEQIAVIAVMAVIIVVLLVGFVQLKHRESKKKRQQKQRFKRGNELEVQAKSFIESKGYRIINEQKPFYHNYKVNGESRCSKLIVDYIAEKNRKKYIIEVKSGKSAISLTDKNSRRQLLEYDFVIENDGIVLLDMENRNMQLVKFQSKVEKKDTLILKVLVITAGVAILLPFWSVKIIVLLILILNWFYPDSSKNIISKITSRFLNN